MLILPNRDKALMNPSEMEGFSQKYIDLLKEVDKKTVLSFVTPNIDFSIINEDRNRAKRIFKCGFLNDVFSRLYPLEKRSELIDRILGKYDIFINERQFQQDVKIYKDKKSAIFASYVPNADK